MHLDTGQLKTIDPLISDAQVEWKFNKPHQRLDPCVYESVSTKQMYGLTHKLKSNMLFIKKVNFLKQFS